MCEAGNSGFNFYHSLLFPLLVIETLGYSHITTPSFLPSIVNQIMSVQNSGKKNGSYYLGSYEKATSYRPEFFRLAFTYKNLAFVFYIFILLNDTCQTGAHCK